MNVTEQERQAAVSRVGTAYHRYLKQVAADNQVATWGGIPGIENRFREKGVAYLSRDEFVVQGRHLQATAQISYVPAMSTRYNQYLKELATANDLSSNGTKKQVEKRLKNRGVEFLEYSEFVVSLGIGVE